MTAEGRKRVAVVIAGAIALTGCSSAATASAPSARPATAPAAGSVTHILIYSINSDRPEFRVILTGAVGDYGPGKAVLPDGKVDPTHSSELDLTLTHGSFRLSISGLDKKIVGAFRHFPANPSTCSGTVTVAGPTRIVPGSGTGSYRGIRGSFAMTATIDEVDVKPACGGTGTFLAQVISLRGTGSVTT